MWDGAAAAANYLEAAAQELLGSQSQLGSILELGSGTGLAGLAAAAALQLPTLLSDLPEVLPALRRNIDANPDLEPLVSAVALDWRAPVVPPAAAAAATATAAATASSSSSGGGGGGGVGRLVLAADCVWLEELVPPFVRNLELAAAGPHDRVLLAHQSRSRRVDAALFGLLGQRFEWRAVPPLPAEPPRGPIDIYWLTPKPCAA